MSSFVCVIQYFWSMFYQNVIFFWLSTLEETAAAILFRVNTLRGTQTANNYDKQVSFLYGVPPP